MDLDTKIRQQYVSQPMQMPAMDVKSNVKDLQLPNFGAPSSQSNFLQDLLHIDPFQVYGSSSNSVIGVQTANFVSPLDSFSVGCSSEDFDVYESKPFIENINGNEGHAHVMENFQFGGNNYYSLNVSHERNQMEVVDADQSNYYFPFDSQESKPIKFVVPDDEVSVISSDLSFLRRVGLSNRNSRLSASIRRACKVRNKSNVVKGQWTVEEDRLLIQLVEKYGVRKWSHIAQSLPGRIGKQCRERWHNHLRPNIKKDTWSNEEDKILIEAHIEIGNKWAEIAKKLPGRTENSIKNHWNATKRRQYSKRKCRSKYPKPSLLQEYIKSLNLDKNPPIDYRKRSSSSANPNNNNNNRMTGTRKASARLASEQFCPDNDRLVPTYDFNDVPDFCFDENINLFQEVCNLDTLLDDMPCAPDHTVHGGDFEAKLQYCDDVVNNADFDEDDQFDLGKSQGQEVELKKEMDLVEMMSQIKDVLGCV
ncbi:transcription factor MYB98-like isoform X2 [Prosopis cineraria]|uniref:transcription factor MYB98-like isoform X2 n=1 Tax=Prosopis cineraria TaxID=364024 RepID=UPI00240F040D|nr:transcription factor MYB98-like isoform X2 [Prosopis cineraria]